MRININISGDNWNSKENQIYRAAVVNVFYVSEMLMIVGICYSIRKSIETARQSENGMHSTSLPRETTESEAIHHTSFISREQERRKTLVRLSQRGLIDLAESLTESAKVDYSEKIKASVFDDGQFERTDESRRMNKTIGDASRKQFAMNDPKQFFESYQNPTGSINDSSYRRTN